MHNSIPLQYFSQESLLEGGCFDMELAIEAARKGVRDFSQGKILFPEKIVQIFDEQTQDRINCLPATLLEEKICGVKWVSVFPNNPQKYNKQNLSAIIILSEINSGFPIAVMDGTLCSNLRVGAVGALAAEYLAQKDSETIGFIGAGEQSKMHLVAMKTVCPSIKECRVSAKTLEEEKKFISDLSALYPDITFIATDGDLEQAITGADIIVTATSAQIPLLKSAWVKEGAFYSHVGGWEDEYQVAQNSDKIVCDDWETVKHRTQTLSRMYKDGVLKDQDIYANLHELLLGTKAGRETAKERIYFNAVGLSYIDISIAHALWKKADKAGTGTLQYLQEKMIFDHSSLIKR